MTIRMGDIWDRTMQVIAGRSGILLTIAVLLLALPSIVNNGWKAYATPGLPATVIGGLLALAAFVLTLWGLLAMIAVASDPAVDRAQALSLGAGRLPAAIGLIILLGLFFAILFIPGFVLLGASGFDMARAQANLPQQGLNGGMLAGFALYLVVFGIFALWVSARLFALYPVIQNERLGVGTFRRSFALTRGAALRIIGVLILYAIVFLVVLAASTAVIGLVARLALGSEHAATVTFIVGIVSAFVTAVFAMLQAVFTAQYYLAARDRAEGAPPA